MKAMEQFYTKINFYKKPNGFKNPSSIKTFKKLFTRKTFYANLETLEIRKSIWWFTFKRESWQWNKNGSVWPQMVPWSWNIKSCTYNYYLGQGIFIIAGLWYFNANSPVC